MEAMSECYALNPASQSSRIDYLGIEVEYWTTRESCIDLPEVTLGKWEDDAGKNLCEAITPPCSTLDEAFRVLDQMIATEDDAIFSTHRPEKLMHNSGHWTDKIRYKMVVQALSMESKDWEVVNRMTDLAALQVNFSGDFNPFDDEGAFLINMINDLAPAIAAEIHKDIGYGQGHLSLWQKFAREERLPLHGRWFAGGEGLIDYIESTPRLLRELGPNSFTLLPNEKQSVLNSFDLSVLWWFLRSKRGEYGEYLELRYLPSMPLSLSKWYTRQSVNMIEVLLDWFYGYNRGNMVETQEAALPAYRYLHKYFPDYVPRKPVTKEEWLGLLEL